MSLKLTGKFQQPIKTIDLTEGDQEEPFEVRSEMVLNHRLIVKVKGKVISSMTVRRMILEGLLLRKTETVIEIQ